MRVGLHGDMTELGITLEGQTFEHLVYHFVLTYSNWEAGTICYRRAESLDSLSEGYIPVVSARSIAKSNSHSVRRTQRFDRRERSRCSGT